MNIFVLDYDPLVAATYHNNKHVVKMSLETVQLLAGVYHFTGHNFSNYPKDRKIYQKTHINHPCSIWARNSMENYIWLLKLGISLCLEYGYRYEKEHSVFEILKWMVDNPPNLINKGLTKFALAMPEKYKTDDVVESYRKYYMGEKREFSDWKKRGVPGWFY